MIISNTFVGDKILENVKYCFVEDIPDHEHF